MKEQKYKVGDLVEVVGWGSRRGRGVIKDIEWIYHPRLGEHTWGYFIDFEPEHPSPLTFKYTPQGYLRQIGEP